MSWLVCRICLSDDQQTCAIANTQFQDIYEKITGYEWVRDDRPVRICYICKSQLQRALKFKQMSKLSEDFFNQIFAVGFEFTEEIVPILNKRKLKTVEIAPTKTLTIEPSRQIKIDGELTEKKSDQRSNLKSCTITPVKIVSYVPKERGINECSATPVKIARVGTPDDGSSISKIQKLGISPMENNEYSSYHDNNDDDDGDGDDNEDVSVECKLEDDSNVEGPPEKICKLEKSRTRKENTNNPTRNKRSLRKINHIETDNSPLLNKNANVYIPTPEVSDISSHENESIKPKKPKNHDKITHKMSFSTPDKNGTRKSFTLTFKPNDIVTPRRRNVSQDTNLQEETTNEEKSDPYEYNSDSLNGELYKCRECGKSLAGPMALTLHLKIHSNDRQFECHNCAKRFTRKSYLNRHMRCHSKEKAYICNICQKGFNQLSNLTQHKRVHTGESPYHCKECDKQFKQLSNLLQHSRVHTGEKPYSCICGKSFTQKSALVQHRRTHTKEKPYSCHDCGSKFSQKSNLTQHMKIAHNKSS